MVFIRLISDSVTKKDFFFFKGGSTNISESDKTDCGFDASDISVLSDCFSDFFGFLGTDTFELAFDVEEDCLSFVTASFGSFSASSSFA